VANFAIVCAATCAEFFVTGCGRPSATTRQLFKDDGRRVSVAIVRIQFCRAEMQRCVNAPLVNVCAKKFCSACDVTFWYCPTVRQSL